MNNVTKEQRVSGKIAESSDQRKTKFLGAIFPFLISTFSFLLCIACENILEPPKTENAAAKDAGMGYFSLTLGGTGRTIMPETMNDGFEAYTLEFFEEGNTTRAFDPVERTYGTLTDPVTLNVGTWDLVVTAYTDGEKTKAVAQGKLPGIIINTGQTVNGDITLRPFNDGGTGTFSWEIDYPSNVTSASMTITSLPAGTDTVHAVDFLGGGTKTGSVPLQTGYYRVAFKLKNNDGLEAERWETLHIYQNMESVFKDTLNPSSPYDIEDFGARAVISIFNIDNTAGWNVAVTDIANGGNDKNYVINVVGDVSVTDITTNNFGNASNIKVSLRGKDGTLTLADNGNILRIGNNQTVILRDATLQGHNTNNDSLVYMNGGTFTMYSGVISGNTNTSNNWGGGVYVYGGTFTMKGGEISDNTATTGGGVYVYGGTFIMHGGEISGNTAGANYQGGGVYVDNGGTFRMVKGTIYGSDGDNLSNTAGSGAALYYSSDYSIAQIGAFSGDTWIWIGHLYTTDDTIQVEDGELDGIIKPADNYVFNAENPADWNSAIKSIATYGDGKDLIINVAGDFPVTGGTTDTFGIASGFNVTIKGGDMKHIVSLSSNGSLFTVGSEVTLTLDDNITLQGRNDNDASLVQVNSGGSLVMKTGSQITGNTTTSNGGGVGVGWDGIFTMDGGEISGNTATSGGGVFSNGIFTMDGGEISGNTATIGGGVSNSGTFTMHDGEISGNTATSGGGGVRVDSGIFTMDGGQISSGNTASNYGGGVSVGASGIFTMWSGEISSNTASNEDGGGVYVNGVFNMYGGEISSGNTSKNGGGVGVGWDGTFTMDGGEIFGNTASDNGGGVCVAHNSFSRIVNGTIYGSDEGDDGLKNTADSGAALCLLYGGTAEFGTFDGTTWVRSGAFPNRVDETILMEDGVLLMPSITPIPDSNEFTVDNDTEWNSLLSSIAFYGIGKDLIINVTNDIDVNDDSLLNIGDVTLTIKGVGTGYVISLLSNGSLFTVRSGVTLTLDNITLQGKSSNNSSLVQVNSGGSLVMKTGSHITGNSAYAYGGGVYNSGTFTMYDGKISGNSSTGPGGGVYMDSGTFRIVTGIIYGSDETDDDLKNIADSGAALYWDSGIVEFGTFDGATWVSNGPLGTTDDTIQVEDGVLQ